MLERILLIGTLLVGLAVAGCDTDHRITGGGACRTLSGEVDVVFADTVSTAQALAFLDGLGRPYSTDGLDESYRLGMRVLGGDTLSTREIMALRQRLAELWRNDGIWVGDDDRGIVLNGFFRGANPDSLVDIALGIPELVTAFVMRTTKITVIDVPVGEELTWVERISHSDFVTKVAQSQWCPK